VRAIILIRANALAKGLSGVRPIVVEKLVELLNKKITPAVPEIGSVGASGDLAPLSHIAMVLIGEGKSSEMEKLFSSIPQIMVSNQYIWKKKKV